MSRAQEFSPVDANAIIQNIFTGNHHAVCYAAMIDYAADWIAMPSVDKAAQHASRDPILDIKPVQNKSIPISGTGIADSILAYWLGEHGLALRSLNARHIYVLVDMSLTFGVGVFHTLTADRHVSLSRGDLAKLV